MSKMSEARKKAIASGDPNRILWLLNKKAARILFQHSLNVVTASELSKKELLKLKGVGNKTIESITMALDSAKK